MMVINAIDAQVVTFNLLLVVFLVIALDKLTLAFKIPTISTQHKNYVIVLLNIEETHVRYI